MDIINILDSNNIKHDMSGSYIVIQCPFCRKEDINGTPLGTFMIDPNSGRGSCGEAECNVTVGHESWLEKFGIISSETPKPRKKYPFKKRDKKSSDLVQPAPKKPAERIKKIEKLERVVSFPTWRDTIQSNFPTLVFPAEVAASVLAQILITDITNPFALVFVDAPSSGKTMTINLFDGIKDITYPSDKFSPASFVSNATNVPKEELENIDLLTKIRYKMLLIRDLAVIFSKSEDGLNESLGLLTRVLDGQGLNTDSGTHGQRHLSGDYLFMMLAASTPIRSRVWKVMGSIGSRLFFLNMHSIEKSEAELVAQITSTSTSSKENVCREMTKGFVESLWFHNPQGITWNMNGDKDEYKKIIGRCAKLLSRLRGVTNAWEKKVDDVQVIEFDPPIIENPDRINQLLYNLCRGHAVVCGRTQLTTDDLRPAIEVTFDSAHILRVKLLRGLLDHDGVMKTHEVQSCLDCSKPTALKQMEILRILRIAKIEVIDDDLVGGQEHEIRLSDDLVWFLSNECREIRGLAQVINKTGDGPTI